MDDIKNLTLSELGEVFRKWGYGAFHSRQVFSWLYKKGVPDFSRMSDLPLDLRNRLKDIFALSALRLLRQFESCDGTEKFLFELRDRNIIEAVSIPAGKRVTGCISSQVGCKFACAFCASGLPGFKRNLTCAEIIEEILCLKAHSEAKKITHIVFMGIGEPLDNYDNVLKAIRVINSPEGLNIGARRITISTSGIIPGIKRLAAEGLQIELSVSLHAADSALRTRLMPVNKKYPLPELISACRSYAEETKRQVTFEYILIKGMNSALENAKKLSALLKTIRLSKVNLIPANHIKELNIEPPPAKEILSFKNYLLKQGIPATLRKQRGEDIRASCGQLTLGTGHNL